MMTEKDIYKNGVALLEEWEDVNYCEHSFKFKDEWLTDKEVVDLLNTQHETIQQVKKVLQEEYSERVKELDHWAEKEDWNSYGATKLEYGTVLRLAKKLGIELE